jgi:L,D-transpeptidase catalytic domain
LVLAGVGVLATRVGASPVHPDGPLPLAGTSDNPLHAPSLAAVRPAFTVPTPHDLARPQGTTVWAPIRIAVLASSRPARGHVVARLGTQTPEGTTNILVVLGRVAVPGHGLWIRVSLPVLPNGTTGWVPRAALGGYGVVDTRLIVDRRSLTATLLRGGRSVFRASIGIGQVSTPTPAGEFYVRDELTRYSSPTYGPLAFGTSARSTTLTDWPAGGYIGIHGTNQPWLLPGRVSHGCIRMRNPDILRLGRLMPIGTPITIR